MRTPAWGGLPKGAGSMLISAGRAWLAPRAGRSGGGCGVLVGRRKENERPGFSQRGAKAAGGAAQAGNN